MWAEVCAKICAAASLGLNLIWMRNQTEVKSYEIQIQSMEHGLGLGVQFKVEEYKGWLLNKEVSRLFI